MDKLIYTAMTGARHDLLRQEVLTHNLANAATPGFRAQVVAFRQVPMQGGSGAADTRVFAVESTPGSDFTPGAVRRTGNPLDVAVNGAGWIAVQGPDGAEAYTRNGNLHISAEGVLQTLSGRTVLSDSGPLSVPPGHAISIARDGTVSAIPTGSGRNAIVSGRIKLVNPPEAGLSRDEDGLFRMRTGGVAQSDAGVSLASESIESSNVNPVEALVGMIALARQFDVHMKLLQNADGNARQATQLLSVT